MGRNMEPIQAQKVLLFGKNKITSKLTFEMEL